MRVTSILQQSSVKKSYKSLALSVYFKHPDMNMKDYEFLSRASAFLLGVDSPLRVESGDYRHLDILENLRNVKEFRRRMGYTPANPGGNMMDMGWLEFVPREYRPTVHVVASSHVYSPFLWTEYYPHEWLRHVKQEHCKYALEIYDTPGHAVAKFDLDANPFHHPEGRDVAFAHFTNEDEVLPMIRDMGVDILHLRDKDNLYQKGEKLSFDGYAVTGDEPGSDKVVEEEDRVFYPYKEDGNLAFHANDRFFATTPKPLPEGLCGAPVLGQDGRCAGVVEGIVPLTHADKRLAGSAAFMPHWILESFQEYVERQMLKMLFDEDMFNLVVTAKKTNSIGGGLFKLNPDGKSYSAETSWEEAYQKMTKHLKKICSKEEYDAYLEVIAEEKQEIQRIMKEEGGGDIGEIMERVRARTLSMRDLMHEQYRKTQASQPPASAKE